MFYNPYLFIFATFQVPFMYRFYCFTPIADLNVILKYGKPSYIVAFKKKTKKTNCE